MFNKQLRMALLLSVMFLLFGTAFFAGRTYESKFDYSGDTRSTLERIANDQRSADSELSGILDGADTYIDESRRATEELVTDISRATGELKYNISGRIDSLSASDAALRAKYEDRYRELYEVTKTILYERDYFRDLYQRAVSGQYSRTDSVPLIIP